LRLFSVWAPLFFLLIFHWDFPFFHFLYYLDSFFCSISFSSILCLSCLFYFITYDCLGWTHLAYGVMITLSRETYIVINFYLYCNFLYIYCFFKAAMLPP
jgi:branched-subunit amino acid ABC-type transport system permease component